MPNPSKAQLAAFGSIIHFYASAESGIKIALAGMLDINLAELLALTEPYSSVDLRNVAKSIVKERFDASHPDILRFLQIVGDLSTFGPLRNNIAHSRWTKGDRRGSIKPFRLDIRSGSIKFHGAEEDERDWTTKELQAEGERAIALNRRLVQFMKDTGIAAAMQRKDDDKSAEIDVSEGSSTKAS